MKSPLPLIGVAVGAGTVALISVARAGTSEASDPFGLLKSATQETRRFEPRVTGRFPYEPVRGVNRSGPVPADLTNDFDVTLARLSREAASGNPRARHAWAVGALIGGDVGTAVATLSALVVEQPRDWKPWSDLSAALLVRAREDDAASAIDAAEQAITLNPYTQEALFNKALALERMGLAKSAIDAWRQFLARAPASGWTQEARQHVDRLQAARPNRWTAIRRELEELSFQQDGIRAVVDAFPQEIREWVADDALDTWAGDVLRLDATAERRLSLIRGIASELRRRGDDLLADAVDTIERASGSERQTLATAHRAYSDGRRNYEAARFDQAQVSLRNAATGFGASPFAHWAAFHLAVIDYQHSKLLNADRGLENLLRLTSHHRYPALKGRTEWVRGLVSMAAGRRGEGEAAYRRSLIAFELLGESENVAVLNAILGEARQRLGDVTGAWQFLHHGLNQLPRLTRPNRRRTVLFIAADTAMKQDKPHAALTLWSEFLSAGLEMNSPAAIGEGYMHRARAYRRLGLDKAADADARRAQEAIAREPDRRSIGFLHAQLKLFEAERLAATNPAAARRQLDEIEAFFRNSSRSMWLTRVHLAQARASIAAADMAAAERHLRTGIEVFETHRRSIAAHAQRVSYQEDSWDLFQEAVELELARGRHAEAFRLAERSRSRGNDVGQDELTIDIHEIAQHIDNDTLLLYFFETRDGLCAWAMSKKERAFEKVIGPSLTPAILRFRNALQRGDMAGAQQTGTELSSALLRPFEPALSVASRLVIVPDGSLHQLPFAALPYGDHAEPLLRSKTIAIAPSARVYVRAAQSSTHRSRARSDSILIAANPDRGTTRIAPLPGAERESAAIASLYPSATVLRGAEATRSAVLRSMPLSTVVHLGTHAIANVDYPELSRFLFAPEGTSEMSTLFAADLALTRFDRLRLVVLAACDSATGRITRSEGVLSLARPFLGAGVPSVVATLWPIDDGIAERLFTHLHRELRAGADPANALRLAQLAVLDDPSARPGGWASIVSFGY